MQYAAYAHRSGDRTTARSGLKTLASHALLTGWEDLVRADCTIYIFYPVMASCYTATASLSFINQSPPEDSILPGAFL